MSLIMFELTILGIVSTLTLVETSEQSGKLETINFSDEHICIVSSFVPGVVVGQHGRGGCT